MATLQTVLVWAALTGAVFPVFAQGENTVIRGDDVRPHQPPAWFVRMASEGAHRVSPVDPHIGVYREPFPIAGVPRLVTPRYVCSYDGSKARFCDM